MSNKAIFIVSKPLQYMVASIIASDLHCDKSLIVIEDFYQAEQVAARIRNNKKWNVVKTVKNRFRSLLCAAIYRPSKLYIDSDVGLRLYFYILIFKALCLKSKVYVYEEGIGTYIANRYHDIVLGKMKLQLFKAVGASGVFGGSIFCNGIYVFEPHKYISDVKPSEEERVFKILPSLMQYCSFHRQCLLEEFSGESVIGLPRGNKCVIYLSSYFTDIESFSIISNQIAPDTTIAKLHPHIKKTNCELRGLDIVVNNAIPAEILIIEALKCFKCVYVVHHGSSVVRYIHDDRLVFIKI